MLKVEVKGCESFVDAAKYESYVQKALDAFDVLESEKGAGNDFLGWKHLPSETPVQMLKDIDAICASWKAKGVDLVIAIGIGGSYLGAKCVIEALSHNFAKQLKKKDAPEVVFAGNNLSEEYLAELMDLAKERNVACIVISKSGTTTEPAVAFRIVKAHLENKYGKEEATRRIVAITDARKGALHDIAVQEGYPMYVIPDNVGGRFSVLTPVGLLPIAMAGFDIDRLMQGARDMRKVCLEENNLETNPALMYAAIRNVLYRNGVKVEMLVSSLPNLRYLAEWWKQLYGESEGKQHKGLLPHSLSITTDLHSMGQYVQDGERLMMETMLRVKTPATHTPVPTDKRNLDGINYLTSKTLTQINDCATDGTIEAHVSGGVPVVEIEVERIDEYTLGQLIYFFEFACGVSGYTLGVNPFDQPGVEAYKKNMFRLLGKPGF